jgi:hypothetical protein
MQYLPPAVPSAAVRKTKIAQLPPPLIPLKKFIVKNIHAGSVLRGERFKKVSEKYVLRFISFLCKQKTILVIIGKGWKNRMP